MFRIEETVLTQTEIEDLTINDASQDTNCGSYLAAFTFDNGTPVDSFGSSRTITKSGTITVPGDGDGLEVDSSDSLTLSDVSTTTKLFFSVQVVFTGEIVDGNVITLETASQSQIFSKSGITMTSGVNLFNGHSNTGNAWILSMNFIDTDGDDFPNTQRFVDFQLQEVGGSLTFHG